jgi:hypothetical protein
MEQYIRAIAGSFVLISLALGYLHSPYWQLFTAFVGLNLPQSAFTRWCSRCDEGRIIARSL